MRKPLTGGPSGGFVARLPARATRAGFLRITSMPRYFIDRYVGRFSWVDNDGQEMLPDEIQETALSALADAVRGAQPEMPLQDMSVNVRDEDDNAVFAASLALKIRS